MYNLGLETTMYDLVMYIFIGLSVFLTFHFDCHLIMNKPKLATLTICQDSNVALEHTVDDNITTETQALARCKTIKLSNVPIYEIGNKCGLNICC